MLKAEDYISPKWLNDIVVENRNSVTINEAYSLKRLAVTIEAVSCKAAFDLYNELMDREFFIEDSRESSWLELKEFLYVGEDGAQFSIVCRLDVVDK